MDQNKIAYWVKRWDDNNTGWHRSEAHINLVQYFDKLTNGKANVAVYFPMCGKTLDMMWVYEQGHSVVGVDIAEKSVKEFFAENRVEYEVTESKTNKLYQSKDGKIKIYIADIFKFTSDICGKFESVWDRAAMNALDAEDRKRYRECTKGLLAPDFSILLALMQHDEPTGPPYNIPTEEVMEAFSDMCDVTVLTVREDIGLSLGPKKMKETTLLLRPKK